MLIKVTSEELERNGMEAYHSPGLLRDDISLNAFYSPKYNVILMGMEEFDI